MRAASGWCAGATSPALAPVFHLLTDLLTTQARHGDGWHLITPAEAQRLLESRGPQPSTPRVP